MLRIVLVVGLAAVVLGVLPAPPASGDGAVLRFTLPPGCWEIQRAIVGLDDDGEGVMNVPAFDGELELALLTWAGSDDLTPQVLPGGDRADSTLVINGVDVVGEQLEGGLGNAEFPQNEWYVWEGDLAGLVDPAGTTLDISGWDANWTTPDPSQRDHTNGAILSIVTDNAPCAEPVSVDVYRGLDYIHHGDNPDLDIDYTEAILFPMTNTPQETIVEIPIFFAGTDVGGGCRGLDLWGASGPESEFPPNNDGGSPNYNTGFDIFADADNEKLLLTDIAINDPSCVPAVGAGVAPRLRAIDVEIVGADQDVSAVVARIALPPSHDWLALQMESAQDDNGESGAWVLSAVVNRTRPDALGDQVWLDANRNCTQDPDEGGFAGATAFLTLDPTRSTTGPTEVVTGADGRYLFSDLPIGTHQVSFGLPSGYRFTEANCAGVDDVLDSDAIPLADNPERSEPIPGRIDGLVGNLTIDAGVVAPVDLELTKMVATSAAGPFADDLATTAGTEVFFQINLSSVATHPAGHPYAPVDSATVSDVLPPGLTFVSATPSVGTYDPATGIWDVGPINPGETHSMILSATVAQEGILVNAAAVQTQDFQGRTVVDVDSTPGGGVDEDDDDTATVRAGDASIGDYVWLDANRDGCQDPGESGVAGVPVSARLNGTVIATTTTDATGAYLFEGLPAGAYEVSFTAPTGTRPTVTSCAQGTDRDSNGPIAQVSLGSGAADLSIDFGVAEVDVPTTLAFTGIDTEGLAWIAFLIAVGGGLLAAGSTRRAWNLD